MQHRTHSEECEKEQLLIRQPPSASPSLSPSLVFHSVVFILLGLFGSMVAEIVPRPVLLKFSLSSSHTVLSFFFPSKSLNPFWVNSSSVNVTAKNGTQPKRLHVSLPFIKSHSN